MLLAYKPRPVTELVQGVDDMLAVVVKREATVSEAYHPVGVRVLPGQEARPAPGARRCSAERLAKEHTLLGELLDVRRVYRVSVRLYPPTRIVGVYVEDVGIVRHA